MSKDLKNRIRVCNTLDKRTIFLLRQLSKQLDIPMSRFFDEAIYEDIYEFCEGDC